MLEGVIPGGVMMIVVGVGVVALDESLEPLCFPLNPSSSASVVPLPTEMMLFRFPLFQNIEPRLPTFPGEVGGGDG